MPHRLAFADGARRRRSCDALLNLVDRETLLDAKLNPEKHQGLMVRVAGYSAPFTCLWEDLQDEIIARSEHGC